MLNHRAIILGIEMVSVSTGMKNANIALNATLTCLGPSVIRDL